MMNNYFSKEDTKVIKGITIILMMMHHLWAFPGRISGTEFYIVPGNVFQDMRFNIFLFRWIWNL